MHAPDKELDDLIQQHNYQTNRIFVVCNYPLDAYYGNILKKWFEERGLHILVHPNDSKIDFSLSDEKVALQIRKGQLDNSILTLLLIGKETWRKSLVDWMIYASLLPDNAGKTSRVLGMLLPTHPDYYLERYRPQFLPPRLYDNLNDDVAILRRWSDDADSTTDYLRNFSITEKPVQQPNLTRRIIKQDLPGSGWFVE